MVGLKKWTPGNLLKRELTFINPSEELGARRGRVHPMEMHREPVECNSSKLRHSLGLYTSWVSDHGHGITILRVMARLAKNDGLSPIGSAK